MLPEQISLLFGLTPFPAVQSCRHGVGQTQEGRLGRAVCIQSNDRLTEIRSHDSSGIQRYCSQESQLVLSGKFFASPLLEEIDFSSAVRADQTAHIFHNAQYGSLDKTQKIQSLAHVGQRNFLRRGHHHALCTGMQSMMVICSSPVPGGESMTQIIQRTPFHIRKER